MSAGLIGSLNVMENWTRMQNMALSGAIRIPALTAHAIGCVAVGELAYRFCEELSNVMGSKLFNAAKETGQQVDKTRTEEGNSWSKKVLNWTGLSDAMKSLRPFQPKPKPMDTKEGETPDTNTAYQVARKAAACLVWSTLALELANILLGQPHPIYNQVLKNCSWLSIREDSLVRQVVKQFGYSI